MKEAPIIKDPSPIGDQTASVSRNLLRALTAPAVLSGFGGCLMVASQSFVSYGIMTVLTAITARNEFVAQSGTEHNTRSEDTANVSSLLGFFKRKASSPGLCSELQGWTYIGTSLFTLLKGHPIAAGSFALFSIGSWAGAALANQRTLGYVYKPILIERLAKNLWQRIPDRAQVVMRDPAASFAVANIPLFAQSIASSISTSAKTSPTPVLLIGLGVGSLLALSAAIIGLRPLFTSEPPEPSGRACIIHGLSNLIIGTCMVWVSSIAGQVAGFYTGSAAIVWAFANFGFARTIEQARKKALS